MDNIIGISYGLNFGPHTWGSLRSIIFNGTQTPPFVDEISTTGFPDENTTIKFVQGFKTTAGNGFVFTDETILYRGLPFGFGYYGPNFISGATTPVPPRGRFEAYKPYGQMINRDRSQLIGQTAVLTSGSITISASAFVPPNYQVYNAYANPDNLTSIGLLTAF